jgi:hypothetical protein
MALFVRQTNADDSDLFFKLIERQFKLLIGLPLDRFGQVDSMCMNAKLHDDARKN